MRKRSKRFLWTIPAALILVAILALVVSCPDVGDLKTRNPTTTRLMKYRETQYRHEGMKVAKRQRWVSLSRISPDLIRAVLISEDDKFYEHEGFDWGGIREAFEKNWQKRRVVMGGSTITQQLAKNLYLKPTRNPIRKIEEACIASRMEKTLSKRRILELYLNVIEWGRGVYGAEAASQFYYDKPASELTLAQAIRLASILPNPIRFSPTSDASKRMLKKRRLIAERMLQKHLIDETAYESLLAELEGHPLPVATPPDSTVQLDSLRVPVIADTSASSGP